MARAQIALIIPLGDAPGHIPGLHPDQGLPGGGDGGEYYPDQGLPGGRPPHVGNRPPGSWNPEYPSTGPVRPGRPVDPGWGWGGGEHPSTGPIVPPLGGTDVPPDEYQPLPPPEDIYSQYVVSVWDPKTASWTTKAYPPR